MAKYKIIISDLHLASGLFNEMGIQNPHEDFYFDDELVEFVSFFSRGEYSEGAEVQLIINGDFFDFLNVPLDGEFVDEITESVSLRKLELIIKGHKKVFTSLKNFLEHEGKSILFTIGNHDSDLFFEKIRQRVYSELTGIESPSKDKLYIEFQNSKTELPGKILITHGNQYEAMHVLDFNKPILTNFLDEPVLNIPWGSFYVLKIANKFKWERTFSDKIRPVRTGVILGFLFDPFFALKFIGFSLYYFFITRFIYNPKRRARFVVTLKIIKQELFSIFSNLESDAREILDEHEHIKTLIMGHTHIPIYRPYQDGKVFINSGSWTKMIHLDPRHFSYGYSKTFVLIKYQGDNPPEITLRNWFGEHHVHKVYSG